MTAQISAPMSGASTGATSLGRVAGFGALFRKELREWRRGRRTWVVLIVSGLFMMLTALNAWLQANFLPEDGSAGVPNPILEPMPNLLNAVSTEIFSIAAIFAVMALLVTERETGTLAWTASKPVSRAGIWLAKFASSSLVLWVVAGLIPLLATVALLFALYGPIAPAPIVVVALGIGMSVVFYVAVSLAASTLVTSQAAVAAIAIGVMFLPQVLGLFVPVQFLPGSALQWALVTAAGNSPGIVTPLVWLASVVALVAFAMYRMERLEL